MTLAQWIVVGAVVGVLVCVVIAWSLKLWTTRPQRYEQPPTSGWPPLTRPLPPPPAPPPPPRGVVHLDDGMTFEAIPERRRPKRDRPDWEGGE
jgi:hypothetical protein